jgi:hypothetical protein
LILSLDQPNIASKTTGRACPKFQALKASTQNYASCFFAAQCCQTNLHNVASNAQTKFSHLYSKKEQQQQRTRTN